MGSHSAFFYGTLMFPGILHRVIYGSREPEPWQKALTTMRPALLEGYERHKVKDVHYPAIIPCKGASVRGSICTGLTDGDIWRLDTFEGPEYIRKKVKAKVLKDDVGFSDLIDESRIEDYVVEELEVDVYIWRDDLKDELELEQWDFEDFKATKMKLWTGEEDLSDGEVVDPFFKEVETANQLQAKLDNKENGTIVA